MDREMLFNYMYLGKRQNVCFIIILQWRMSQKCKFSFIYQHLAWILRLMQPHNMRLGVAKLIFCVCANCVCINVVGTNMIQELKNLNHERHAGLTIETSAGGGLIFNTMAPTSMWQASSYPGSRGFLCLSFQAWQYGLSAG